MRRHPCTSARAATAEPATTASRSLTPPGPQRCGTRKTAAKDTCCSPRPSGPPYCRPPAATTTEAAATTAPCPTAGAPFVVFSEPVRPLPGVHGNSLQLDHLLQVLEAGYIRIHVHTDSMGTHIGV